MPGSNRRVDADSRWNRIVSHLLDEGELTHSELDDAMSNPERGRTALAELVEMGFVEQTDDGWFVSSDAPTPKQVTA